MGREHESEVSAVTASSPVFVVAAEGEPPRIISLDNYEFPEDVVEQRIGLTGQWGERGYLICVEAEGKAPGTWWYNRERLSLSMLNCAWGSSLARATLRSLLSRWSGTRALTSPGTDERRQENRQH